MALSMVGVNSSPHVLAPFCSRIRDFMYESQRLQTFFANCEAISEKQVESIEGAQVLATRIYYTMFAKESDFAPDSDPSVEPNDPNFRRARLITENMFLISQRYHPENKLYFSVVWVFYFVYKTKTVLSTPVFKIYKKKLGRDAVFLDFNLISYSSWDEYLDVFDFPESFLCFPRNGEYTFFDKLDLEYMRSPNKNALSFTVSKPFSQSVLRPMLDKILRFGKEFWELIKSFVVRHKSLIIKIILCVAKVCLNSAMNSSSFLKLSLMLFGNDLKARNACEFLMGQLSSSKAVTPATDFSVVANEIDNLIRLFQKARKNWHDILLAFGSLFLKCTSCFIELFIISRLPPLLKNLFLACNVMSRDKLNKSGKIQSNPSQSLEEIFKENLNLLDKTSLKWIENNLSEACLNKFSNDEITSPQLIDEVDGRRVYVIPLGSTEDLVKRVEALMESSSLHVDFENESVGRVKDINEHILGSVYKVKRNVCVGLFPLK